MTGPTPEPRRLNLNESPFPPAPEIVAAVAEAALGLNRYPTEEGALMEALGAYAGVAPERIVPSDGSNELLHLMPLISGAKNAGDHVVIPECSFPTYMKVAGFYGLSVSRVPLDAAGAVDVLAMLAAIRPDTRMICVPSPNNPTGGMLNGALMEALVAGLPKHVMLHFDEAYYEFGRAAGGPETLPHLERLRGSWIATRSFSKAFGLAGIRLGYGIAPTAQAAARWRALRPNFTVGRVAIAGGIAAVRAAQAARDTIDMITAERAYLAAGLRGLGLGPLPSAANFLSIPAAGLGAAPVERMARAGLVVGGFELAGAPFLRITIGRREDSEAVLGALAAMRGAVA